MSNFVNLHNHSAYSLLDGLCKVSDLVAAAAEANMPAVALTDHGNMFGTIEFYNAALRRNINPIIGMEAYISKEPIETRNLNGIKEAYNHMVLLARNMEGYKNLIKLASIGYEKGFYYRPTIDDDYLEKYSKGLIGTSACIKGLIPELLLKDKRDEARDKVRQYLDIFDGEFYIELQDHGIDEELIAKERLIDLAREMDVKLIVTNDGHYRKKEHAKAHEIMLCIRTKTTMSDPNRFRLTSQELYFKNRAELEELFPDIPDAFDNTLDIAKKCNVIFEFGKLNLPKFPIPEEYKETGADPYLTDLCKEGLEKKIGKITEEVEKRLNYELTVIQKMNFSEYFLVVKDFTDFARNNQIPVGPGRGSAAGSLVSYSLGITNLNPMDYDLLFERFLNPERVTMPDIDIDFCYERRDEIIQYVRERYREECVTQIITFGKMNAKGVIRDVGRAMDLPYEEVDRIAKLIPDTLGIKLKDALQNSGELADHVNSNAVYKQLFEYAEILEGMERHSSVHAAGIVIAPKPLTEFLPLYKEPRSGKTTTQYTMNYIEDIGLLKMDILGLRNLTVISDAVKMIAEKGVELNIEIIPLNDKKTYNLFARGDTIGVFQFESTGMRDYLRKLKPESIEDLTAMNALYRPGPLGNNMVDDFILRKHGEVDVKYIHPMLEPILNETYGVIVYQEQVMRIAGDLAGFSLGEADLLRRAMGKKKVEIMEQKAKEFNEGAAKKGIDKKIAAEIFDHIAKFAGYGFNKSHSAAYSLIAYQTAYLKAHHPSEFMAANLSSEKDNTDRIVVLLEECRHMGIDILPPDVMKSGVNFTVEDGAIRFGLAAIKNVGSGAMGCLIEQRENYVNSKHFFEFCEQCDIKSINKKVLESLIKAGALDSLPWTRTEKYESIETALNYAHQSSLERERGQTNIFDSVDPGEETSKEYPSQPIIEQWSKYETLAREKEVLGFYISGHPLDKYRDELTGLSTTPIEELSELENNTVIRNGGIIVALKVTPTKRDKKNMAFFTLEDFSGSIEAVLFADLYEEYKNIVKEDKMVFLKGKISKREEDNPKIIVEEMHPISKARQIYAKKVLVNLTSSGLDRNTLESLESIFEKHKGNCTLFFNVRTSLDEELIMKSKKYKLDPGDRSITAIRKILGKDNVRIVGDNGLYVQAQGRS